METPKIKEEIACLRRIAARHKFPHSERKVNKTVFSLLDYYNTSGFNNTGTCTICGETVRLTYRSRIMRHPCLFRRTGWCGGSGRYPREFTKEGRCRCVVCNREVYSSKGAVIVHTTTRPTCRIPGLGYCLGSYRGGIAI